VSLFGRQAALDLFPLPQLATQAHLFFQVSVEALPAKQRS
jgi:hypothetical protein